MFSDYISKKRILYLNDRHEEKDTDKEDRRKIYDKRILPLLKENDSAIFAEAINPFLWDYYRSLGLAIIKEKNIIYANNYLNYFSLTKAILADQSLITELKKMKFDMVIPYIESDDTQLLSKKIGAKLLRSASLIEWINNKTNYRQVIKGLNFPEIAGDTIDCLEKAKKCFEKLKNQGFKKIVLKKERSVSGFGLAIVESIKALEKQLKNKFFNEKHIVLEGFIEGIKISPNVQYWVGEKKIDFIVASDQLLAKDRISYAGNIFPSQLSKMPEIWRKIENFSLKFCQYLQKEKCYGIVGIDFLVTKNGRVYSPEANVRFNGSTFPAFVVKNLFSQPEKIFWQSFNMKISPTSFENLFRKFQNIFVTKKRRFGLFPIGVDLLPILGEGQFMVIAQNFNELKNLSDKFQV